MKFFKMTNRFDPEDEFYTSSTSQTQQPEDLARILKLEDYFIEEVTEEEFERETGESYEDGDSEVDSKMRALSLLDAIREYVSDWTTKVHLEGKVVTEDELQGLGASLYTLNQEIERI